MARLRSIKPRLQPLQAARVTVPTTAERRITGSRLQSRRYRLWLRNPHCAECGRLVAYPGGFELDHKVPLYLGGEDSEGNCQILCNGDDGCHARKTAADLKGRGGAKV